MFALPEIGWTHFAPPPPHASKLVRHNTVGYHNKRWLRGNVIQAKLPNICPPNKK